MTNSPVSASQSSLGHPVLETPKKLHYRQQVGNEENATNGIEPSPKRPKTMGSSQRSFGEISIQDNIDVDDDDRNIEDLANARLSSASSDCASELSVARLKGWLDDFGKQNRDHFVKNNPSDSYGNILTKTMSTDSDCESDVSVAKLKGWLDDFGTKNRVHFNKVNHIGKVPEGVPLAKPIRPKCPSTQPTAPKPVKRSTDQLLSTFEAKKGPARTPIRYKPRIDKEEVKATNDGYASVKKLSAWLADEPFSDKKLRHVRKGVNVIKKSRLFEKDLANVILEEDQNEVGVVSTTAKWLQLEPTCTDDDARDETSSMISVTNKKKWLESAFNKCPVMETRDDTPLTVADKKRLLQTALKAAEKQRIGAARSTATPSRRSSDTIEAIATKATSDSAKATVSQQPERAGGIKLESKFRKSTPGANTWQPPRPSFDKRQIPVAPKNVASIKVDYGSRGDVAVAKKWPQPSPLEKGPVPTFPSAISALPVPTTSVPDATSEVTSIDKESHVDFSAARQLLVQRSAQNGNPVAVLSKVQMRKNKFEKLEKDIRRRSGPMGLLKQSWEQADPTVGPTTAYTKTYVEDIVPKKSFDELP